MEENRDAALTMSEYLGPTANRMGRKGQDRIEELIGILSESIPIRGSMKGILGATDQASRMASPLTTSRAARRLLRRCPPVPDDEPRWPPRGTS